MRVGGAKKRFLPPIYIIFPRIHVKRVFDMGNKIQGVFHP